MDFNMRVGSRAQVMNGTAKQTTGGLKKANLKYNKSGRIVSKKKSVQAKKDQRLKKAGWTYEKGVFGAIKMENMDKKGSKKKGSKKKGSKKKK
tara:strand:- start:542 stop:820 length:279 start_codon:yes stop_codon:yes gene_type:complete